MQTEEIQTNSANKNENISTMRFYFIVLSVFHANEYSWMTLAQMPIVVIDISCCMNIKVLISVITNKFPDAI